MRLSNGWTGERYSLFRAAFGSYLAIHFAQLVPWGAELFSNRGALPKAAASPLVRLFPNLLALCDPPWLVTALLVVASALSAALAAGFRDRIAAVILWYLWACLLGRDPLIQNPGIPYVGWLLLAHACLPPAAQGSWEIWRRPASCDGWRMPEPVFAAAWILMAVGYSYSGLAKLASPSWLDGTALARILDNPLARPGAARDLLLAMPQPALAAGTWGVLGLELLFAPLALFKRARPWLWLVMLCMHLLLIAVLDFADLGLGMVMLHLFTFDPAWMGSWSHDRPSLVRLSMGAALRPPVASGGRWS